MNTRVVQVGLGLLALIGVVIAVVIFFPTVDTFRGTQYDPAWSAPEIALTRADGSDFKLSEMQGKIVLLFFGYTSCPDVCPTTLSELKRVLVDLEDRAGRVQVVFITVDPERDTPERLQEFVSIFHPNFLGLSGSLEELEQVWSDYGVYRKVETLPNSASSYLVNHSARTYLIDQEGKMRLSYSYGTPPDDLVHDLKIMLGK